MSPGVVAGAGSTSAQAFAESIADRAEVLVLGLQVWHTDLAEYDGLTTEVDAVRLAARGRGWHRYHLFGFSAGATVALAAARTDPGVRTLALFEPASIGSDEWSDDELQWRRKLRAVRALAAEDRPAAFRRLVMAAGDPIPEGLPAPAAWDARVERLEDALADTAFTSGDLVRLTAPTLVMSGGRSNPRFARVAQRLVDVMPAARAVTFAGCSHLAPPHRVEPDRLATELASHWRRSPV